MDAGNTLYEGHGCHVDVVAVHEVGESVDVCEAVALDMVAVIALVIQYGQTWTAQLPLSGRLDVLGANVIVAGENDTTSTEMSGQGHKLTRRYLVSSFSQKRKDCRYACCHVHLLSEMMYSMLRHCRLMGEVPNRRNLLNLRCYHHAKHASG